MLSCSKKKPIRYKKLKPQRALAISLWFRGLLKSPEFYSDWSDWPVRIKSKFSLFFDCTVNQIESLIVVHFYFTSTDFTVKVEGLILKVTFCQVYFPSLPLLQTFYDMTALQIFRECCYTVQLPAHIIIHPCSIF